jgi:hypothetical protein
MLGCEAGEGALTDVEFTWGVGIGVSVLDGGL